MGKMLKVQTQEQLEMILSNTILGCAFTSQDTDSRENKK